MKGQQQEKWEVIVNGSLVFTDVSETDERIRSGDIFLVRLCNGKLVLAQNIFDFGLSLIDLTGQVDVDAHLNRKQRKAILWGRLSGLQNANVKQLRELHSGRVLKAEPVAKAT